MPVFDSGSRILQSMAQRILALVPQDAPAPEYLTSLLDEALDSGGGSATPMGIVAGTASTSNALASARKTAENIENVERICARPEGIVDLGTIEWLLRPSLPLVSDRFTPVECGPWKNLDNEMVATVARIVCRVDICIPGFEAIHLGTAFVVGKDTLSRTVLLTNAHVVDTAQIMYGWPKIKEVTLRADFDREIGHESQPAESFDAEFKIHAEHDLAILFLPESGRSNHCYPRLCKDIPVKLLENPIGVIGHPSFDSRLDPFPRKFGFGDAFGVKRFSPGLIRAIDVRSWRFHDVFVALHDATTLSGSSGSCVFDLQTLTLCGLHFGGWPRSSKNARISDRVSLAELFEANGAVPIWKLANDPFFESIDIAWS